ncbi:hypothetical protein EST38_g7357 [Candolleomyces aberdarensis]|uniref:Uncharacterized protein n=1 Tax=Candolleomyces aberdarensis TaxID=2316362 RepID=A0A4Q2DFB8_9AGAR|nr:hypothetical protein EST38_g7357 [Candolleomyces aberdarensis]
MRGLPDSKNTTNNVDVGSSVESSLPLPDPTHPIPYSACLAAKNALRHLKAHQGDIEKAIHHPDVPIAFFAGPGFNEEALSESRFMDGPVGVLVEEIQIRPSRLIKLGRLRLKAIGKACAPFASRIVMPSGEVLEPPIYDSKAKTRRYYEEVVNHSSLPLMFGEVVAQEPLGKGLVVSSTLGSYTRGRPDGAALGKRTFRPTIRDAHPGHPPCHVQFDVSAAIHPSEPESLLEPQSILHHFRLKGGFDFQFIPGETANIDFTSLEGDATAPLPNAVYGYSQTSMKVVFDAYDTRWRCCAVPSKGELPRYRGRCGIRGSSRPLKRCRPIICTCHKPDLSQTVPSDMSAGRQSALRKMLDKFIFGTGGDSESSQPVLRSGLGNYDEVPELHTTGCPCSMETPTSSFDDDHKFVSSVLNDSQYGLVCWMFEVDDDSGRESWSNGKIRGVRLSSVETLPGVFSHRNRWDSNMQVNRLRLEMSSVWSLTNQIQHVGGGAKVDPSLHGTPQGNQLWNIVQLVVLNLPPTTTEKVAPDSGVLSGNLKVQCRNDFDVDALTVKGDELKLETVVDSRFATSGRWFKDGRRPVFSY